VRVNPDDRLTAGGTPIGNCSALLLSAWAWTESHIHGLSNVSAKLAAEIFRVNACRVAGWRLGRAWAAEGSEFESR
jgi:hypothetical protein